MKELLKQFAYFKSKSEYTFLTKTHTHTHTHHQSFQKKKQMILEAITFPMVHPMYVEFCMKIKTNFNFSMVIKA